MTDEEITRWAYRDVATKERLRQALEGEFGPFDHFGMTATDLASFGLKKFGLPASADSVAALDAFLLGRQHGKDKSRGERVWPGNGIDSAGDSLVDRYINSTH